MVFLVEPQWRPTLGDPLKKPSWGNTFWEQFWKLGDTLYEPIPWVNTLGNPLVGPQFEDHPWGTNFEEPSWGTSGTPFKGPPLRDPNSGNSVHGAILGTPIRKPTWRYHWVINLGLLGEIYCPLRHPFFDPLLGLHFVRPPLADPVSGALCGTHWEKPAGGHAWGNHFQDPIGVPPSGRPPLKHHLWELH